MKKIFQKGGAQMVFLCMLVFFFGVFWLVGRELYKNEGLAFAQNKKPQQNALILEFGTSTEDTLATEPKIIDATNSKTVAFATKLVDLYLRPDSGLLTEDHINKTLGTSFSEAIKEIAPEVSYYKIKDIKISKDVSEQEYRVAMGQVGKGLSYKGFGNEISLYIKTGVDGSDEAKEEATVALRKASRVYEKIIERLLAVSVPETLAQKHLAMINGFLNLSLGTHFFAEATFDPIYGFLGTHFYKAGLETFENVNTSL